MKSWLIPARTDVTVMEIEKDMVVELAYTLKNEAGEVLDEGDAEEPLYYLHGHGNLLPRFEEHLAGLKQGAKSSFVIPARDGYGELVENNQQDIERTLLPSDEEPEVGMQLAANFGDGYRMYEIIKVTTTHVTIDMNHPLAGVDLHFDVEVLSLRKAEPEEVAHGHVHGPGGHHH
jgi:FKBP-type peptidyl-prolyl cis-trans isomerase SlyD